MQVSVAFEALKVPESMLVVHCLHLGKITGPVVEHHPAPESCAKRVAASRCQPEDAARSSRSKCSGHVQAGGRPDGDAAALKGVHGQSAAEPRGGAARDMVALELARPPLSFPITPCSAGARGHH